MGLGQLVRKFLQVSGDGEAISTSNPLPVDQQGTVTIAEPVTVDGSVTADTELPTAVELRDDVDTPTVPAVGSYNMGYDENADKWNMARHGTVHDLDTGQNHEPNAGVSIRLADSGGSVPVSDTDPLPVSATSLPLPSGAATAANQLPDGHNVTIDNTILPLPAGASTAALQQTDALTDTELRASAVPVSAATLPLPTGAATSSQQLPDGHAVDTELPAAAAMADDSANPTVPAVASHLMGYNDGNSDWNRVRHGTVHDLDTGTSQEPNTGVSLREEDSGGSNPIGVPANPIASSLYGISGSTYYPLKIDDSSRALQIISYAHHEIHSASNWRVQAFDDAIASSGTLVIGFQVKDQTKLPHWIFEYETEGLATIRVYEGVTITGSTGTDVDIKNSRRDHTNTSIIQGYATGTWTDGYVTKNPTWTGGSVISLKKAYTSSKAGGGSGGRRAEIILKANEEYVIEMTNDEANAKGGQIRLEWYEHADAI